MFQVQTSMLLVTCAPIIPCDSEIQTPPLHPVAYPHTALPFHPQVNLLLISVLGQKPVSVLFIVVFAPSVVDAVFQSVRGARSSQMQKSNPAPLYLCA